MTKQSQEQNLEENKKRDNKKKKGTKSTVINKILQYKKLIIAILIILIAIVSLFMAKSFLNKDDKVLTIGNIDYYESDYMAYVYSIKYNLYGIDNTTLPEATLNSAISGDSTTTVAQYLKDTALSEIKTSAIINIIANEEKISLNEEDKNLLITKKNELIEKLGGEEKFKDTLNKNHTTIQAYDKMAESDLLYKKVYDNLYSEGKINDLTLEEKDTANKEYQRNYTKIRQVFLTTVNVDTLEMLDEKTISQKKGLINLIRQQITNENFNEYIKTYSEDVSSDEESFAIYYETGQLIEELEKEIDNLKENEISDIITSKYGYHIIIKDVLDDGKLIDVYNKKREEKLLANIAKRQTGIMVIYHNPFNNIEIKN
ncbi:MAG: peptidylprolyl isomerase [bacterium]|nr:peptidylprolyl isomerase [bacterium]